MLPINLPTANEYPVATGPKSVTGMTSQGSQQSHKSTSRHLMLIPSLACQACCAYCFGPNRGPVMSLDVFDCTLDWIDATTPTDQTIDLTFHGGEPLLAGLDWYQRNLPRLRQRFGNRLKLHLQSNLWLLDDAYCALFKEYDISLGTSLDGPEPINDPQRGAGYFAKTMAGVETARRNGLGVGVICTFTRLSAPRYQEVCDFFADEHLGFSVHAAVCALNTVKTSKVAGVPSDETFEVSNGRLTLSPDEHANLFVNLFDYYLANVTRMNISNFDTMVKGISAGQGGLCTFGDCLGGYLTLGPEGGIYSCNRFAHHPEWRLADVHEQPDLDSLAQTPAWQQLRQRELTVEEDCGDCAHFNYCKGGCAYNAITGGSDRRDPHCPAYKRLFDHMTTCALDEVFSKENLEAVVVNGPGKNGLLRKGKLIQIMRGGPHPQKVARQAREVVAAVALAVSDSPEQALDKLDRAGIITRPELALQSLTVLRRRLDTQSQQSLLVNAYLHVTYACNLKCAHCYAHSAPGQSPTMAVDDVVRLVREAAQAGFGKAVITGGEPLAHSQRDDLLDALATLRQEVKPLQTVLRTNLAYSLTPELLQQLTYSTDQVVVSVDGDEASHNTRRGNGSYARTIENLKQLLASRNQTSEVSETSEVSPTEVEITAVLTAEQIAGLEGDAVRTLGEELSVRVRFKSVLPLGRGDNLDLKPNFYSSLDDGAEAIAYSALTATTCGLGMNLYIGPHGECYPCYALMGAHHHLGNALDDGLATVLAKNDAYRQVTVDSNHQCHHCALRYVCGGFCRAWCSSDASDAPPIDCTALHLRAHSLLLNALEALDVTIDDWQMAGLPIPVAPPTVKRICNNQT